MDINKYSPKYEIDKRNLVRLADCSTEEIFEILYAIRSTKMRHLSREKVNILSGNTVVFLYKDASIRTRSAINIGVRQLGGHCLDHPMNDVEMMAGENIRDIADVTSSFGVSAIITRGIEESELDEYCRQSPLSIINFESEDTSPVQAACDLFTIWEKFGRLEGLRLAYVGRGGSNASSLVAGAVRCGMDVRICTPPSFPANEKRLLNARQYGSILETVHPFEAVENADIVYTDGYMGAPLTEKENEEVLQYQVNETLMTHASPEAVFMHPLPAKRDLEVTAGVIDGPSSIAVSQGQNKLHTIKALLILLVK